MEINSWRYFFNNYAPRYHKEPFTQHTVAEVDFLEEQLSLPSEAQILDLGCGSGRHALELARRGYQVTGLDISEGMLDLTRQACEDEGLEVTLIHANALDFSLDRLFSACICLCEGAFGLLSGEEEAWDRDRRILSNIHAVLEPGAKFILTALNGLKMIREHTESDVNQGRFDPVQIVEHYPLKELLPTAPAGISVKEKGFVPSELRLMLLDCGFSVEEIWGGSAGNWRRERLRLDEMEIMAVSHKRRDRPR